LNDPLIWVRAIHFAATMMVAGIFFFLTFVAEPTFQIAGDNRRAPPLVRSQLTWIAWIGLVVVVISGAAWLVLQAELIGDVTLAEGSVASAREGKPRPRPLPRLRQSAACRCLGHGPAIVDRDLQKHEQAIEVAALAAPLGQAATETAVKAMSADGRLARARVVHFATHGLIAGELKGLAEPALVLTPPADDAQTSALEQDDGV